MRLKGKKALVTGASRGIGKAIALRLANEGADVCIHYVSNIREAEETAARIKKNERVASIVKGDLNDTNALGKLADDAWHKMEGIDILVNNAGVSLKKHFLDYTIEDMHYLTSVNFTGTFFLTQYIAKKMIDAGKAGSIYTITSVNGIRPGIGLSGYGATKGALETLMKAVAVELAPHHINVNTIAVGAVETDMNASVVQNPEAYRKVIEGIPLGRFGTPEEVALLLVDMIASGTYLAGASITLDGGLLSMRGYGKPEKYKKN